MKNTIYIFILGITLVLSSIFGSSNTYALSNTLLAEKNQSWSEPKILKNFEEINKKRTLSLESVFEETTSSGDTFTGKTLEEREEDKVKQDINASIVEFIVIPKAKQIVKELSTKLTVKFPDSEERIEAYKSIKNTLILRKNRIEWMNMSETGKYILKEFPNQMIELLDKKIEELK